MSDVFMAGIFAAKTVKATARVKLATGEVRSVSLHNTPAGVSESDFADAAKGGVDLAVRVKGEDDRVRTLTGKGVFGAAAVSATCSVLGYSPNAEQEKPKPRKHKDTTTEPKVKDEPTIG